MGKKSRDWTRYRELGKDLGSIGKIRRILGLTKQEMRRLRAVSGWDDFAMRRERSLNKLPRLKLRRIRLAKLLWTYYQWMGSGEYERQQARRRKRDMAKARSVSVVQRQADGGAGGDEEGFGEATRHVVELLSDG